MDDAIAESNIHRRVGAAKGEDDDGAAPLRSIRYLASLVVPHYLDARVPCIAQAETLPKRRQTMRRSLTTRQRR